MYCSRSTKKDLPFLCSFGSDLCCGVWTVVELLITGNGSDQLWCCGSECLSSVVSLLCIAGFGSYVCVCGSILCVQVLMNWCVWDFVVGIVSLLVVRDKSLWNLASCEFLSPPFCLLQACLYRGESWPPKVWVLATKGVKGLGWRCGTTTCVDSLCWAFLDNFWTFKMKIKDFK